jgi:hypothetical protein
MIFPEEYPKITKDLSNERVFHSRFKKELGREFTVYYSVRLSTPDVPMREIDFLVISPRMILCIELKNGKWRYKDKNWEFYNRRGKSWEEHKNKPYKGPVEQIRTAKKILKDFLYHHNSFEEIVSEEYFQSSIFFLKNDPGDFPITDREKEFFVGKSKLKNANTSMQEILSELQNNNLPPLPHSTITKLHNIIRLNLNYATDIYSKKKTQNEQLVSLTKDQFEIIRSQKEIPHAIVLGVPGSGKTVVATEYAFRLEASHKTTLFITSSPITAKILANLVRWFSVDFATPETIIDLRENYDYIIMDSSEHYLTVAFLEQHKDLLKNKWKNGDWLVLGDWNASLKNTKYREGLDYLRRYYPLEVIWKKNIRTPKRVFEHACILGRREYEPSKLPDITGIHFAYYENQDEFFQKIEWAILYGVRDLGIDRSDIVILSLNEKLTEVILDHNSDRQFRSHFIAPYEHLKHAPTMDGKEPEELVSISNLDQFQGREAAYTIVVGIEDFNDSTRFDDYFHALTRCTSACTLLYPKELQDQLSQILRLKSTHNE